MDKISIIVPIYNAEDYLNDCITNLINQTHANLEIILINDGSTDNSFAICEKYAKTDSRITIINQYNKGVSSARNAGIKESTGRYIMFCDSDDVASPYWCETMFNAILLNPNSLNVANITRDIAILTNKSVNLNEIASEIKYYNLFKKGLSGYTHNKIYNANIIKSNNIYFDEKYSVGEDVKFNIEYLKFCKNIIYIDSLLYFYNTVDSSITQKYNNDALSSFLMPFYIRINHIDNQFFSEYCDGWLYHFINLFDNVFDKRNTKMTLLSKFKYNNLMIKSEEFQYCVENSSEGALLKKVLKLKNYYIFWLFQKLIKIKQKFKG